MIQDIHPELISQLGTLGITLYQHQEEGVAWMIDRERDETLIKGGCLSDDPGLGKTNQMLATILVIMPNFLTLAGGLNHIGVVNARVAMSMAVLVPRGTVRELNITSPNSTTLKLVQSM